MEAILRSTQGLVTRTNSLSAEQKTELDEPEVWPVDALLDRIEGLTQTNKQLRELVAYLSVLVIKNIVEQKSQVSR